MPVNAVQLEEERLTGGVDEKPLLRERHRVFPAIFEDRKHHRILDVAAGLGYTANRIREQYSGQMFCNDLAPTCLRTLRQQGLPAMRYTLDNAGSGFPIADEAFDAVISMSTIEHIIEVDAFVSEVHRILEPEGCFYLSTPNYAGLLYLWPVVWNGRTFHDPIWPNMRYEFYGHVRYFTYQTLLDYVKGFGFVPEVVYLPVPKSSTIFQDMQKNSRAKAFVYRWGMNFLYRLSPRWSSEPIICFRKTNRPAPPLRKVIL